MAGEMCLWAHDDVSDAWDTACDRKFCFITDGPRENDYRFCPGCGRRIRRPGQKAEARERRKGEA